MTAILTLRFFDFSYLIIPSTIRGIRLLRASAVDLVRSREGWCESSNSIALEAPLPWEATVDFNSC